MVSDLAFYSDYPRSNPAEFSSNYLYDKTKISKKEAGVGPPLKKYLRKAVSKGSILSEGHD